MYVVIGMNHRSIYTMTFLHYTLFHFLELTWMYYSSSSVLHPRVSSVKIMSLWEVFSLLFGDQVYFSGTSKKLFWTNVFSVE